MSTMSELDIDRQEQGVSIEDWYEQRGWSIDPSVLAEEQAALEAEAYE